MGLFSLLNFTEYNTNQQSKCKISYPQQCDLFVDMHNNIVVSPYIQSKKNEKKEKKKKSFLHQEISIQSFPLLPEGYERIILSLYFLLLPYIAGLIFLFTYVSKWDYHIYLSLNHSNSYLLTWCIGYEIIAGIALLIIVKNAIFHSMQSIHSKTKKRFQRP